MPERVNRNAVDDEDEEDGTERQQGEEDDEVGIFRRNDRQRELRNAQIERDRQRALEEDGAEAVTTWAKGHRAAVDRADVRSVAVRA